jgi:hypothetical protein
MSINVVSLLMRAKQRALQSDKTKQFGRLGFLLLFLPFVVWVISKSAPENSPDLFRLQLKIVFLSLGITALLISFPTLRSTLSVTWRKLEEFEQTLETSQRLYLRVVQVLLLLPLLYLLDAGSMLLPLLGVFAAFCAFVAGYDGLRWYKSISEHMLGKAAIALLFAVASTFAYAMARQEISAATHVVPTNFQHTTILMAIMTIPLLVVVAGAVLFGSSIALSAIAPLFLLFHDMPKVRRWLFADTLKENPMKYLLVTRGFQIFFYATLGAVLFNLGKPAMVRYEKLLLEIAPSAVFELDMYYGRECPLQPQEKLAALGDSKFLIGRPDRQGKVEFFGPVKCEDLPTRANTP